MLARLLPVAGVIVAGVGGVGGCEKSPAVPPGPAKPKATAWATPLAIGPISYFNTQCVSCHGPYGQLIADHNVARNSGAADYRAMVEYMVTDRAGSSLKERDMDAQTAYCASLAAVGEGVSSEGSPIFVCIKEPVMTGGLEGEVTPGCTVAMVTGKGQVRIDATVEGHTWRISPQQVNNAKQSAGDDWVNATVEARGKAGVKAQVLQLSDEAFKGPKLKKADAPAAAPKQP